MEKYQNKTFLIGITFLDMHNRLIEQFQTHGEFLKIENGIMHIKREDDSIYHIPFMEEAITKANPGIYRERSTGIKIQDPDFLTQWTVDGIQDASNIDRYKEEGFIPQEWIPKK